MALSATFTADFTSFTDAVEKADVKLKTFQDDAGKVESALTRMSNSFSGTKIIQDATLMVEAVERVGGVSKLTEAELAKVSRTATEAAEKLKALGQDVPVGIQKLADASKGAAEQSKGMAGSFDLSWASINRFAGALGIGFGITQLVSFGKSVFESASNISDLSSKLGTSAEFVQRMSYAAGQTGTTIDTVSTSINFMNATLSKGDNSTKQALADAHLSFDAIRAMKPEDAFYAIADGIKSIPDPMKQSEVQLRLFSKAGSDLLPAIKQGIKELGDQTTVMSDTTVDKLDAAWDAWDKYGGRIKNVAGEYVLVPLIKGLNLVLDIGTQISHLDVMGLVQAMAGLGPEFEDVKNNGRSVAGAIDAIAASLAVAHPRIVDMGTGLRDVNDVLAEFDRENRQNEETMRRGIAAYEAHQAAVKALVDQWSGAKLAERVALYTEALTQMNGAIQITANELPSVVKQIDEFRRQGAALTPELFKLWVANTDFNSSVDMTGSALRRALEATEVYGLNLLKIPPAAKVVAEATTQVTATTDDYTKSVERAHQAVAQFDATWTVMSGHLSRDKFNSASNDMTFNDQLTNAGFAGGFMPVDLSRFFQPRAAGGPVEAGTTYMVGERGPELFTPSTSGMISPNGSGGGTRITIPVTINVQGSILATKDELARLTGDAIAERFADLGYA